ncbi:MAG TPA: riboflavin synthase, partial [Tepidiformaceae bacterium]|nr:riboflavin synthase [Tepidiformaceae bacterium]
MFTGIIEEVGTVVEAAEGTLRIRAPHILTDSQLGDSIAINGVDLTVAEMDSETFFANLMPETYR